MNAMVVKRPSLVRSGVDLAVFVETDITAVFSISL